jgi:hypothetical protein
MSHVHYGKELWLSNVLDYQVAPYFNIDKTYNQE